MNTAIIYSSKYGSTEDCAKTLKAGLSDPVSLINIDSVNPDTIEPESFDTIILGSSIYVGNISKKMKAFCNGRIDILKEKKLGIFLCCALPAGINEYLSTNFSPELLKSAVVIKCFGGEARIGKMKTLDKLIMKAATKGDYESLNISRENLEDFISEINAPE